MILYFCACIDKIGSFCLNFGINLVFCAFLCYTYSNYKEEMQNTFPFEIYFCGIWGRISVFGRVCIFLDKKQLSRTRRCNFGAGPPRRTSILPRGPISYLCGADSLRRAFFAALFFLLIFFAAGPHRYMPPAAANFRTVLFTQSPIRDIIHLLWKIRVNCTEKEKGDL